MYDSESVGGAKAAQKFAAVGFAGAMHSFPYSLHIGCYVGNVKCEINAEVYVLHIRSIIEVRMQNVDG